MVSFLALTIAVPLGAFANDTAAHDDDIIVTAASTDLDRIVVAFAKSAQTATGEAELASLESAALGMLKSASASARAELTDLLTAPTERGYVAQVNEGRKTVKALYKDAVSAIARIAGTVRDGWTSPTTSTTTTSIPNTPTTMAPGTGVIKKPQATTTTTRPTDDERDDSGASGNGSEGSTRGTTGPPISLAQGTALDLMLNEQTAAAPMPGVVGDFANILSVSIPPGVVTAALSPLIVAEILVRTLFESARDLIWPAVMLGVGVLVILRKEREVAA